MEIRGHEAFPHFTRIEWEALHRLAAVSGEIVVMTLLSAAFPEQERTLLKSSWYASSPTRIGEYKPPRSHHKQKP